MSLPVPFPFDEPTPANYMLELSKRAKALKKIEERIKFDKSLRGKQQAEFNALKAEFETHVRKNQSEILSTGRQCKTEYGNFGIKATDSLRPKEGISEDSVIETLKKNYKKTWTTYVKIKESLRKKALATLTDKQLDRAGLVRKRDTFWVSFE